MQHLAHIGPDARVLFVGEAPCWPLDQGFRIHGFNLARALAARGAVVRVASMSPLPDDAPEGLRDLSTAWPHATDDDVRTFNAGWSGTAAPLRRRLARFGGNNTHAMAGVVTLVRQFAPTVVIGLGQNAPLLLRGLGAVAGLRRVWYAGDELVYFHISCARREAVSSWPARAVKLAHHAALEALFTRGLEGAIGVSPLDARLLRTLAGAQRTATIRNGVDLDYFAPLATGDAGGPGDDTPTVVFWGRLDFEPNIDAVRWFAQRVWPAVRRRFPHAVWQVIGKNAGRAVADLASLAGVRIVGEVDDIRPWAKAATVTVLPMRCGGGIKNKLLEAAAMGCAMVASPKAVEGLEFPGDVMPALVAANPSQWLDAISRLILVREHRRYLSRTARAWAEEAHNWDDAAAQVMGWLPTLATTRDTRPSTDERRPVAQPSLALRHSHTQTKREAA